MMYDPGNPAAPQPQPISTLEEQRHGAKMLDNGDPEEEEERLVEGRKSAVSEKIDPLAATRHAGKILDNGKPAAPEPLPLLPQHQEQEWMFDTGEVIASKPVPPQSTALPIKPPVTLAALPPPTDVVDVGDSQRMYDNEEITAPQVLSPPQQQQQQQQPMLAIVPEPLATTPAPTATPQVFHGSKIMDDNGGTS